MGLKHLILSVAFCLLTAATQHHPTADKPLLCSATTTKPQPKGTICGQQGALKKGIKPVAGPSTANNFAACRDSCLTTNACNTFAFDHNGSQSSGSCILYGTNLANSNIESSKTSGEYYWNVNCFSPTFYNPNPIRNGGFETGEFSPAWTTYESIDYPQSNANVSLYIPGYLSRISTFIQFEAYSTGGRAGIEQSVTLCATKLYDLSIFYNVTADTSSTQDCLMVLPIEIYQTATGDVVYSNYINPNTTFLGQWIRFVTQFAVNSTQDYTLSLAWGTGCSDLSGTVLLDDISIYEQT